MQKLPKTPVTSNAKMVETSPWMTSSHTSVLRQAQTSSFMTFDLTLSLLL